MNVLAGVASASFQLKRLKVRVRVLSNIHFIKTRVRCQQIAIYCIIRRTTAYCIVTEPTIPPGYVFTLNLLATVSMV